MSFPHITTFARDMRKTIVEISYSCGTSTHIGGALSMTDVMSVLYAHVLRYQADNPRWDGRDRFILSKGHGVLGYFPALLHAGIIDAATFATFQQNGSHLIAHPVMNLDLGIESSNGSLGHGISMAVGLALAAKKQQKQHKIYTLLGDGETNEGSVWEAAMLASHLKLDNLVAIIDYNKMQNDGAGADILHVPNMAERFAAFGWHIEEVNGHDIEGLVASFAAPCIGKPKAIIAHTIKGKGIDFMENDNSWHHNRLTANSYEQALKALAMSNQPEPDNNIEGATDGN